MHKLPLAPRRGFSLLTALSLLLLAACGGSKDRSTSAENQFPQSLLPEELHPDLPLIAPETELETPVFSGIVDVAPGEDVTFCTFTDVILEKDTIFGESYGAESPFGHHAILQYTTTPREPHTGDCGQMDGPILLGGTGGKTVANEPTLPTNFGITVPAGAQLVINHHWINTSPDPIRGQAMMLARALPEGGDTVEAGSFPMLGLGWELPPQSPTTFSTECKFAEDVSYVLAIGHMHEYGVHVDIDVLRATGGTESFIDEDWTPESATTISGGRQFTLEDPYVIHKDDTVKLTCNWNNDTGEVITFPREMCIFFGFTIGTNAYCVNGAWLTSEQLGAAGVNGQDITDHL